MQETLEGTVAHIIFRNEDNGYTVFELETEGKELTCVGFFSLLQEGQSITAQGHYEEHASYGRQFKVESFEDRVPDTEEAVERYLASGAIKGIGAALAHRVVKMFGDDTFRILTEEPERLAEVKGISMRKAQEIGVQAAEQLGMRKAMIFLQQYGISVPTGVKIYHTYGEEIYAILRENPYRLAEDVNGIGFRTADRIAMRIGITQESEFRIRSGILYTLMLSAGEGSCYQPEALLIRNASQMLGVEEELVSHVLTDLMLDRKVIMKNHGDERIVYSGRSYYLELNTARMLHDLNQGAGENEAEVEARIARLEKSGKIVLEEEQREAVKMAALHGLFVLTGGPGTGKTTTINEIIRYFISRGMAVLLAAPTGRAAKRMTETTGYEASTIHRLLEISSSSEEEDVRFERNDQNPLEEDVVIIDEMSMVDISLMHALLAAIAPGTHLILVGDQDQLPSVGPGSVLRDIIASEAFPCVRLTRIFRQDDASDIVVNAHKINHGEPISLTNKSRDFFFMGRTDVNVIISNIIRLIRDRLPNYVNADPFDIQVLSPVRKGLLGVERLNLILQEYLNPPSPDKAEKTYGDRKFRVGDKVMQIRNNYQLVWEIRGRNNIPVHTGTGIFNGDMGIIKEVNEFASTLTILFDENRIVDYPFGCMDELELAYAVTIHKSQGSEYPAVILPLLSGPHMLMTRNLLYTAVTRAKSCVVILGKEETVNGMIANETEQRRYTTLDERIRELCTDV